MTRDFQTEIFRLSDIISALVAQCNLNPEWTPQLIGRIGLAVVSFIQPWLLHIDNLIPSCNCQKSLIAVLNDSAKSSLATVYVPRLALSAMAEFKAAYCVVPPLELQLHRVCRDDPRILDNQYYSLERITPPPQSKFGLVGSSTLA